MFAALAPFCFLDSLQASMLLEEDTHDGVTTLLLEGKHNLWLVGLRLPFSVIALLPHASIAMSLPEAAWRHCRCPC